MMLPDTSIRSLDPADYEWKQLSESPTIRRRRPLGNEAMWLTRPKDDRDIFVWASLSFKDPIERSPLKSAFESAWKQLRLEIPELELTTGPNPEDGSAYMQYRTPRSEEDVNKWVKQTSSFTSWQEHTRFPRLRKQLIKWKRNNEEKAILFAHAEVEDENSDLVRNLQLMVYVDHLITDGIGARILLGRYLSHLAYSISTSFDAFRSIFRPDWTENHNKLSRPWICFMNFERELSGTQYEEGALWNQDVMLNRMVRRHSSC